MHACLRIHFLRFQYIFLMICVRSFSLDVIIEWWWRIYAIVFLTVYRLSDWKLSLLLVFILFFVSFKNHLHAIWKCLNVIWKYLSLVKWTNASFNEQNEMNLRRSENFHFFICLTMQVEIIYRCSANELCSKYRHVKLFILGKKVNCNKLC